MNFFNFIFQFTMYVCIYFDNFEICHLVNDGFIQEQA